MTPAITPEPEMSLKNFFPLRQGCHIFDTRWSHFQN
jgi:hypothetical protein